MTLYGIISVVPVIEARDGKRYSYAACQVAANNEKDAARIANEHDPIDIDWADLDIFDYSEVYCFGPMPSYGWIGYQHREEK